MYYFSNVLLLQEAVAIALEKEYEDFGMPHSYLNRLQKAAETNRNIFVRILSDIG